MTRVLALFAIGLAILWYLLVALAARLGLLAAAAVLALGVYALVLFAVVLIAAAEFPEEPR